MVDTNTAVRDAGGMPGHEGCKEIADTLARIGDKWTVLVVGVLSQGGTMRYNEILRRLEGISQRMLTLTLKGLEEDGLVRRTMYPTIPPRVEYELTDLGQTLIAPLSALGDWAVRNRPAMLEARKTYALRKNNETARHAVFFKPK
jgi:DNA-binding HxlR family transcriptional regulator